MSRRAAGATFQDQGRSLRSVVTAMQLQLRTVMEVRSSTLAGTLQRREWDERAEEAKRNLAAAQSAEVRHRALQKAMRRGIEAKWRGAS